jgi:hypothetical protein
MSIVHVLLTVSNAQSDSPVPPVWTSTAYVTALCSALAATTAAANSVSATATTDASSSSEFTEAVAVVPWRALVHNLLCGSLPRVPTLQELIEMRQSFEAAAVAAVAVEQMPTVAENDAPAHELQPVEDVAASTTAAAAVAAAATGANADVAAVTGEANSASRDIVSAEGEKQLDTAAVDSIDTYSGSETVVEAAPVRNPLYNVPLWFEQLEGGTHHSQLSHYSAMH